MAPLARTEVGDDRVPRAVLHEMGNKAERVRWRHSPHSAAPQLYRSFSLPRTFPVSLDWFFAQ